MQRVPHSSSLPEADGEGGIFRLKQAISRHGGAGTDPEDRDADLQQVFSRLLLIANVFTPLPEGSDQQHLDRLLAQCGLVLVRSDCLILEKCRIGNSQIMIARYSLEYREGDEPGGRTLYLEGNLSMQTDHQGRVNISISAKPWTSSPGPEPVGTNETMGEETGAAKLVS